ALEHLAVLAPDALGLQVWRTWRREMPFLTSLHRRRHVVLRSVHPTITPVNFATLVTGATPGVHQVATKHDTIACESLFDIVRAAGRTSLGAGQPGATGGEFLARHAELSGRVDERSDNAVTERVLSLVEAHRPCFVIAQLLETDTVFHRVGPSSPEAETVVRATDQRLRQLVAALTAHDYGVIVLADHGQHDVPDAAEGEHRGTHGTESDEDSLVPCTWTP
ncbi:MAG: alkaline phosphatase family protein, partial [Armatimonadota bacterium]